MKLLQERIVKDGQIEAGNILKVDSFLNHQIDVSLLEEIGKEFHRQFAGQTVNKILTIEASGIAIACIAARYFQVPVVFAKKTRSLNIAGDVYTAKVESFTHKNTNDIIVSKKFLSPGDRILIVDDFLANGKAILGLAKLVEQAGATLVGAGVVIEKGFQDGGKRIREAGIDLRSLAIVEEMDTEHGIRFREETL
ncbi:xanthine phosphoribosyltransferase [Stomatobaculum longum]|uniref:xanthine phosphoribosyltransferase n=2 Tax=Stomatobaculum longum TaxID=796942 RepID=UPI001CAD5D21|nr:xanthine phosphoribosyltransferase [Stomatobaculum longum]MBF1256194.1 xanthine phosphoribosyltransferase [Stomatobaculum longum]